MHSMMFQACTFFCAPLCKAAFLHCKLPHAGLMLQIGPLQQKLVKLQSGSILITKEEREAVEKVAAASIEAY